MSETENEDPLDELVKEQMDVQMQEEQARTGNSNTLTHCCGDAKMCALTCCPHNLDLERIKTMVLNPKFICKTCGRVANDEKHLCVPVSLIGCETSPE